MFARLKKWWSTRDQSSLKKTIVYDDDGVELRDQSSNTIWRVSFTELAAIAAWKIDLFSYDEICVGFQLIGSEEYCVCSEENLGWRELLSFLKARFSLINDHWEHAVTFPAFAENFTVIWRR